MVEHARWQRAERTAEERSEEADGGRERGGEGIVYWELGWEANVCINSETSFFLLHSNILLSLTTFLVHSLFASRSLFLPSSFVLSYSFLILSR